MSSVDMYPYAVQAANALHWNPDLILAQWKLETGNFSSKVFQSDHNLAGIKYVSPSRNPGSSGPGRSASDGGKYAHYNTVAEGVQGYINFVKANHRYDNVASSQDARTEAELLHQDGWATDPNYADKIMSVIGKGSNTATTSADSSSGAGFPGATPTASGSSNGSKSFARGSDIIEIIDKSLSIKDFDIMHPVNSLTQDAGAIALRVVLVLMGLIIFIFALVAIVEKVAPGTPVPIPV